MFDDKKGKACRHKNEKPAILFLALLQHSQYGKTVQLWYESC